MHTTNVLSPSQLALQSLDCVTARSSFALILGQIWNSLACIVSLCPLIIFINLKSISCSMSRSGRNLATLSKHLINAQNIKLYKWIANNWQLPFTNYPSIKWFRHVVFNIVSARMFLKIRLAPCSWVFSLKCLIGWLACSFHSFHGPFMCNLMCGTRNGPKQIFDMVAFKSTKILVL